MKWKYVFVVVVVDDGFGLAEAGVDDYTRCRRFFQLFKNVSAGFLLSLAGARPNPPACGRHHLLFLVFYVVSTDIDDSLCAGDRRTVRLSLMTLVFGRSFEFDDDVLVPVDFANILPPSPPLLPSEP